MNKTASLVITYFANAMRKKITADVEILKSLASADWSDDDTEALKEFIRDHYLTTGTVIPPTDCSKWCVKNRGKSFPYTSKFVGDIMEFIKTLGPAKEDNGNNQN